MQWSLTKRLNPRRSWWGTLAFRLASAYAISGMLIVFFATASLYVVLVTQLERSTNLFLADKVNVLRALLRERPTMSTRFGRKWNWSQQRGVMNSFIFACWMNGESRSWRRQAWQNN